MTNEEYLKSYTGIEFKKCIDRYISKNELAPYIDWERWLSNERSTFFFKGCPGKFKQKDGTLIPCTIVEQAEVMGCKTCKIIVFDNGKNYLLTVLEEDLIWEHVTL